MLWSEQGGLGKGLCSISVAVDQWSRKALGALLYLGPQSWEHGLRAGGEVTSPKCPVG